MKSLKGQIFNVFIRRTERKCEELPGYTYTAGYSHQELVEQIPEAGDKSSQVCRLDNGILRSYVLVIKDIGYDIPGEPQHALRDGV